MAIQQNYIERMEQAYRHKRYFSKIIQSIGRPHTPEQRFNQAFADTKDYLRILDYGCGSGIVAWNISRDVPSAQVIGYDHSLEMVEIARERFIERNLTFSSTEKDFEDEPKFDFIILSSVLHEVFSKTGSLHDVNIFLKKISRYLRPGGFIISRDPYVGNVNETNIFSLTFQTGGRASVAIDFFDRLLLKVPSHLRNYYGPFDFYATKGDSVTLRADKRTIFELLNKLTWGEESLPRESQELIYCIDKQNFRTFLPKELSIVSQKNYRDANFLFYLNDWVKIDLDRPQPTHLWTLIEKIDI